MVLLLEAQPASVEMIKSGMGQFAFTPLKVGQAIQ